ncbi:DNA polymerase subunit Cdc27 [Pisolithus marmoratus]|nr:DNA polymerase subunit Cdc27 [Pisolithus marmoratus]
MTQAAQDYLTKEIFIRRSVVTFRSLSRELGIHVNDAKNELKTFYEASVYTDAPAVPTYLVSGEIASKKGGPSSTPDDYDMDLDLEDENGPDVVYISKVVLVDADGLDETVAQLSRIFSVHVYCLSPSKLKDADLICASNVNAQKVDASSGPESFPIVGKIRGTHVEMRTGSGKASVPPPAVASSSKMTLEETKKQPSKPAPQAKPGRPTLKEKPSLDLKESVTTTELIQKSEIREKAKPSGKLDWGKAKSKEKEKAKDRANAEGESTSKPSKPSSANKTPPLPSKSSTSNQSSSKLETDKAKSYSTRTSLVPQRGVKRKSEIPFDSEEDEGVVEPSKPIASSSSAKVKNGVVLSDDDQEEDVRAFGRRRARVRNGALSDTEMSVKAMMDIDDDQVVRVCRTSKVPPKPDVEEDTDVEIEEAREPTVPPVSSDADDMDTDDEPIVKPKKRAPKKVVPVGRNGLKKKRVIKTRTTTDAKGYMQTEDYSSYESVEEEDAPVEQATKSKSKSKKGNNEQPKTQEPPAEKQSVKNTPKVAPKRKGGAAKRGSLLNFFGPDKDKK